VSSAAIGVALGCHEPGGEDKLLGRHYCKEKFVVSCFPKTLGAFALGYTKFVLAMPSETPFGKSGAVSSFLH